VSRPPRIEFAGAVHHVMARGVRREEIFRDDRDWSKFLAIKKSSGPRIRDRKETGQLLERSTFWSVCVSAFNGILRGSKNGMPSSNSVAQTIRRTKAHDVN